TARAGGCLGVDCRRHEGALRQMRPRLLLLLTMLSLSGVAAATAPVEGATHLPAGRFGTVTVYIPEGTPQSVAIFLSGDGGWNLGVVSMAHALTDMGAVVIGVDIRKYLGSLGKAAL